MATVRKRTWTTATGETRSRWTVDFCDSAGRRQRRQFKLKRDAEAFLDSMKVELRTGTYRPDAAKITVGQVCSEFLKHCEDRAARGERMSPRNVLAYRSRIHCWIAPELAPPRKGNRGRYAPAFDGGIGHMTLAQLTAREVGAWRDRMRDAGCSVAMTRKVVSTLGNVLSFAIAQDYVAKNAAKDVKVIGKRGEGTRKIVAPSKMEVAALLNLASEDLRVRITFAAATGLRASEQWALRWRHLDLDAGFVQVETAVDPLGNEDATKTEAGVRSVPLGSATVRMLKAWKLRSQWSKPADLVFPNRRGGFTEHNNFLTRQWKPLFALDGAPDQFNWHSLRHFAVSCWIEAGMAPKTVQTFAGHSQLAVTMDRYGHLFPSDQHRQAMDMISDALVSDGTVDKA